MIRILRTSSVCLVILLVTVESSIVHFDESSSDVLCFVCECNGDGSSVDCSRRGLTEIPGDRNDKVRKLNISINELSTFPDNLSRFPNLLILDLSQNQISSIPQNALYNLTQLQFFNLSRNAFEAWTTMNPNEVLIPAISLKVLDLSRNKFLSLGALGHQELFISASLETLILDSCDITSIHGKSPLSGLTNIKVFKLSNNPLRRIQNLMSATLRSLDISHCQLSFVHHDSLSYLPALIYLQMAHNYRLVLAAPSATLTSDSLKYLDISFCNVMQPSLGGFPNLKKAVVSHNMVRFLTSNEFRNNTKLEYMDLSYNSIGSLRSDSFRGLNNLKYLDVSWNEIATIPEGTFLETPVLSQINLSRNYLTKVGHLKSLSLTTIDMSQCEIGSIGKDSLESLKSLIDLNLSRNLLSHIPDSISSNTLQYLNINYNRINSVNNATFYMLPRLTALSVIGNRFTTIWNKSYFQSNPYLEKLNLNDNMWLCDCSDNNMYDFYEYLTLEPNKKEEAFNLVCNGPNDVNGQTWLEACYFTWFPTERTVNADGLVWFLMVMIIGLALVFLLVNLIKRSMKRRLAAIQAERERQVEEARDRLRQLRIRAEQEAQCNAPDPRDLVAPPSYDEALSMPKLNVSCHSLNETGSGKSRRKRGRRKTKSSGDLLEETERNGDIHVVDDFEMTDTTDGNRRQRRRRRSTRYGSHEIAELDHSPSFRRRRMSEYNTEIETVTVEVDAEIERPLRPNNGRRRNSTDDDDPRESDF